MKAQKSYVAILVFAIMLTTSVVTAQEEKESYGMAEITYMLPKIGMEKAFEEGVKVHNEKYHKDGPFKASLDYIMTGKSTGWYVWVMGPCTFSDLDNRPDDDAHKAHWDKNISPLVAKYGRTEYWKFNNKLSYSDNASTTAKFQNVWIVEIKNGQYYKFKEFMEKINKSYEKRGTGSINIYDNEFKEGDGRDVAIVWSFSNWAEMDDDDGGIKKPFEEIYGEGSWSNAIKDWQSSTERINSQVWRVGLN